MASDVDLVVEAINGLKSNVFKDYIFPIGTLAISAFVGLKTSFYAVRYAEDVKADIHKIRVLNQTLLSANQMRNSLIAIKGNYHGKLLSHPIQRVLAIPPLASSPVIPQFNPIDLSFLADRVALASLDEHKWIRIEYIDTLFRNFDNAVQQWKLLTNEKRSLQPQLNGLMSVGLNNSQVIDVLGRETLCKLIDLTEQTLLLTDQLLVEISCFLVAFPNVSGEFITKQNRKRYGGMLRFELPDSVDSKSLLSSCPPLDLMACAILFGTTIDELKYRYRPIYT
ncbi:hypothetical protein [Vibrio cyclitrophicus]|uniref:hypothetical protein n=1 Tax=Vibrio cyclitrophicus TaxID=47951 RepID=UPI0007EEDE1F|nr:hypothetical protein [Vibrio cyclitrophicus]OBT03391.1 hypothetical protein A9259_03485 [Vibrio cyclitrophicus]PMF38211.1 hypothetical protein BCV15_20275 [Vibrio cyclitrophicus]PMI45934.1 hypothetical protein BCU44_10610 [Vibrio cyclitrophicus]